MSVITETFKKAVASTTIWLGGILMGLEAVQTLIDLFGGTLQVFAPGKAATIVAAGMTLTRLRGLVAAAKASVGNLNQ